MSPRKKMVLPFGMVNMCMLTKASAKVLSCDDQRSTGPRTLPSRKPTRPQLTRPLAVWQSHHTGLRRMFTLLRSKGRIANIQNVRHYSKKSNPAALPRREDSLIAEVTSFIKLPQSRAQNSLQVPRAEGKGVFMVGIAGPSGGGAVCCCGASPAACCACGVCVVVERHPQPVVMLRGMGGGYETMGYERS